MSEGFLKAQSDNLPLVDSLMVANFFSKNELFTSAKQRGVNAKRLVKYDTYFLCMNLPFWYGIVS